MERGLVTEQEPEYVKVNVTEYGNLYWDSDTVRKIAYDLMDLNFAAKREAREAYLKTPEGIAKQEAIRLAGVKEAKRIAKVQKRWQWLHDKLASKGCECNHDWCGDY
jgi:hypothetical protein